MFFLQEIQQNPFFTHFIFLSFYLINLSALKTTRTANLHKNVLITFKVTNWYISTTMREHKLNFGCHRMWSAICATELWLPVLLFLL